MQKPLFALLFILFTPFLLSAQEAAQENSGPLSKGSRTLGGSVSGSYFSSEFSRNLGISLSPAVGSFVADRLLLSLSPHISYGNSKNKITENTASNGSFGLGALLRYYLPSNVFFEAGPSISRSVSSEAPSGITFANVSASTGYAWFIRDNIAIEPRLSYTRSGRIGEGLDWSGHLSLFAGLQFYLN